ncbi:hypothetical protein BD770DRAFT_379401 [Pilaira anomala]|nr:hypothetical protein BD770DRAFT_379401 [Pilaira anomala]
MGTHCRFCKVLCHRKESCPNRPAENRNASPMVKRGILPYIVHMRQFLLQVLNAVEMIKKKGVRTYSTFPYS